MALTNPAHFFTAVRASSLLGSTLDQSEIDGLNAILEAMAGAPLADAAYALATACLETGTTMKPVREANWLSRQAAERYFFRMYDIQGARPKVARILGNNTPGDGVRYCGRGYVQLTGYNNYKRAADELGLNLVYIPDLAMDPDCAAKIMRQGMDSGWFTGKSFSSYLPRSGRANRAQFKQARRIINGQDRADDIAGFALKFQSALEAGGWV